MWDKREGQPSNDQSDIEIGLVSGPRRADRMVRHFWNGFARKSERDIRRAHPTQKPVEVMLWCLGFLPDAQTILDPFMGSGTTLVACQRAGRRGTGIELDPGYFQTACDRVHAEWCRPRLDLPPPPAKPEQQPLI